MNLDMLVHLAAVVIHKNDATGLIINFEERSFCPDMKSSLSQEEEAFMSAQMW